MVVTIAAGLAVAGQAEGATTPNAGAAPGVPEPASWALMLGGFALLGTATRRRPATAAA